MPPLFTPADVRTIRPRWTWYRGQFVEGLRLTVGDGRIVGISRQRQTGEIEREDLLLLPGLVNAHTHLEFSSLDQPIPYQTTFASWIRNVVAWRREQSVEDHARAVQRGLMESVRCGVAAVGEISTRDWNQSISGDFDDSCLVSERCLPFPVIFREALGLAETAVVPQLEIVRQHLAKRGYADSQLRGLSPHAPYSLHPDLFAGVVQLARESSCPLEMHLAETEEELELLRSGTGPLAELFMEWGLWKIGQVSLYRSPLEVLRVLAELPRVLVVHGNYLTEEELEFLRGRENMSVVYCPRTHSYFRHSKYPLAEMLKRGIRVVLGTDSRASNPDLNLLADFRHAVEMHPGIEPRQWIEMATCQAAEALGIDDRFGTIDVGKSSQFCEFKVAPQTSDPWESLLMSTSPVNRESGVARNDWCCE